MRRTVTAEIQEPSTTWEVQFQPPFTPRSLLSSCETAGLGNQPIFEKMLLTYLFMLEFSFSRLLFRLVEPRVLEGKEKKFEDLFREYKQLVVNFFQKRNCGEESHDLAQKTFIKAYQKLPELNDSTKFKAWLLTIARNTWINSIRDSASQKRDSNREVALQPSHEQILKESLANPLEHLLQDEALSTREKLVVGALFQLPDQMRKCISLRIYQELKYDDIARIMNLEINTVKSHLNQAKTRLKQILDKNDFDLDF